MTKQQYDKIKLDIDNNFAMNSQTELQRYLEYNNQIILDTCIQQNCQMDEISDLEYTALKDYERLTVIKYLMCQLGHDLIDNVRNIIGPDTCWEDYGRELLRLSVELEHTVNS